MKSIALLVCWGLLGVGCAKDDAPTDAASASSQHQAEQIEHKFKWNVYDYPLGQYKIEFPVDDVPRIEWSTHQFPFGEMKVNQVVIEHTSGGYTTMFMEYPYDVDITSDTLKTVHDGPRQIPTAPGETRRFLEITDVVCNGLGGLQSDALWEFEDGSKGATRYRTFGQGTRIYTVMWNGRNSDLESDFVQRYLDSFKVTSLSTSEPSDADTGGTEVR